MNSECFVVFFDVDNTILNGYSQRYFIKYLFKNKKINIFYLLTGYVWFLFYKLQIIKSPKKAIEFLVNFFKGWKEKDLESLVDYFFDEYIEGNLFNQAIDEVKEHIKNGHKVVLISTSLEPIVKKIGLFMGDSGYFFPIRHS